ncbi:hypothetical protein SARC_17182 [Sphaeroforma arctica JP610]|uniref:Uncharacterized protein n=1 Tax=Sphaeroforma arctica JP610 TaxID=667725 RepID=A0A0L0F290_9EUKA|nr:hypothetical protein SARC_17182 [Sphaeroforma arctica JP610]KNC70293.1 hypothetical protein SARC_17182 [Sphaeroforma arctica JP610]|eukprot:XP_014144195.1 hypothetical protein SARC_17182 [Sphaeroforma arctica JP610]
MKDIEPLYSGTEATACSRKKRAPPPPLSQPTTPTRKHVSGKPTAAPCIVPRPDKVEKNMQTGTTSASPSPPPTSHGRTPTTRAVVSDPPTPKRPIRAAPVPPPKLRRKPSTPPISPKARPTASHTSTPATPLFDTPTTPQANTPTTPQATTPTTPQATTPTASQTNTHLPPLRSRLSVHPGGPAHNATLTQTPKIKTPIARAESIATRSRMASSRVCVQCDHPVSYGSGDWLQIGESAYHR